MTTENLLTNRSLFVVHQMHLRAVYEALVIKAYRSRCFWVNKSVQILHTEPLKHVFMSRQVRIGMLVLLQAASIWLLNFWCFLHRGYGKLTFNRLDRSSSLCFCNCGMTQIGTAESKQLLLSLLLLLLTRFFQYVNNLRKQFLIHLWHSIVPNVGLIKAFFFFSFNANYWDI